jgi:hypothetical protein
MFFKFLMICIFLYCLHACSDKYSNVAPNSHKNQKTEKENLVEDKFSRQNIDQRLENTKKEKFMLDCILYVRVESECLKIWGDGEE